MSAPSSVTRGRERPGAHCDTHELFRRWRRDQDLRAREALVREYLPLARKLASRWRDAPEPFEDLVQVATVGLLGAIDRFDPDRGRAFRSYAIPTILGELKRHFRDHCWKVHVRRSDQELALALRRAGQDLAASRRRTPTVEQLAEYLEITVEQAITGLEAAGTQTLASLDAPVGELDEESGVLAEMLGRDDEGYGLIEAKAALSVGLAGLTDPERQLLTLHYRHGLTQRQIATLVGVSQMQVSRLLRRTLAKLRCAYDGPVPDQQRADMPAVLTRPTRQPSRRRDSEPGVRGVPRVDPSAIRRVPLRALP